MSARKYRVSDQHGQDGGVTKPKRHWRHKSITAPATVTRRKPSPHGIGSRRAFHYDETGQKRGGA